MTASHEGNYFRILNFAERTIKLGEEVRFLKRLNAALSQRVKGLGSCGSIIGIGPRKFQRFAKLKGNPL